MKVELISWTKDPIGTIAKAAATCYKSEPNINIVKKCINSSHFSVLEFANFVFKISNIDRATANQLVRHRIASYAQESQRFTKISDVNFIKPEIKSWHEDNLYSSALSMAKSSYNELLNIGVKKEDARAVLPNACPTTICVSMNLRSLAHFMNERLCCFDKETEVLTNNGWKKIKDCCPADIFYSFNIRTNKVEMSRATSFISYPVNEELIHLKTRSVDHLCTKDHNMLVSKSYAKNGQKMWEIMTAQQAMESKHLSVKKDCLPIEGEIFDYFIIPSTEISQHNQYKEWKKVYKERKVPMKEFLQFLGFYLSDGCYTKSGGYYNICLSKGDYNLIKKYEDICKKITNNTIQVIKDKTSCWKIVFHDINLFKYVEQFGKAKDKYIPSFVWELDYSLLHYLFEGFRDGDMNKEGTNLTTISSNLANDFQRLLLHLGYSGTLSCINRVGTKGGTVMNRQGNLRTIISKNPTYSVSVNRTQNEPLVITSQQNHFIKELYCDEVYCVELAKNHILYTRRNGKTCWSGNCRAQRPIREMAKAMIEAIRAKQNDMGLTDEELNLILGLFVPKCESGSIVYCPEHNSCGRQKTAKEINDMLDKNKKGYNGQKFIIWDDTKEEK